MSYTSLPYDSISSKNVLFNSNRSYRLSRCYNQNKGQFELKMSPAGMIGILIILVCCICTNNVAFGLEENDSYFDQLMNMREARNWVCTKVHRIVYANSIVLCF